VNDDARYALAAIVGTHGRAALADPRRIRAMLRDAVPGARLEVSLLVAAIEDGIPERLQQTSTGLVGGEIERLAAQLEADRGFAARNAEWAVRTIASVLGPHGEAGAGPGRHVAPQQQVPPFPPPTPPAPPSTGGGRPWQPPSGDGWAWVPIPAPGERPAVPVAEPRRERTPNRAVRTVVIAAGSALVLAAAVVGVVLATRGRTTPEVSSSVQQLLDELPDEYSQAGVCRPWSDPARAEFATPLAAVECDPAKASWPDPGFSPDSVRFERYPSDEAALRALMALARAGSQELCPNPAYAPEPDYDGQGFRERYACTPTDDGRLRLMRVWERGVIGVVYTDPENLDAHYAWFESSQAAVG
jgi:hypothetical protein